VVNKRPAILIIDDEEATCNLVCEELTEAGYVCEVALDADDTLAKLKTHSFDLALLDILLPNISGMDLLKMIRECYQTIAVVMMTGVNDLNTAVEAMKLGASDYIVKPFTLDKLIVSIATVLKNKKPPCVVYHTIPGMGDADRGKNTHNCSFSEINAIAYGVDARVDYLDFHSKIVTDESVEIARQLGLPRTEIEKWAVTRERLYSERDKRIKSMLNKLERNMMAQVILGLTSPIYQFLKSTEEQN